MQRDLVARTTFRSLKCIERETEAVVATPKENFSHNVVKNTKKRKQLEITDFFAEKDINKK